MIIHPELKKLVSQVVVVLGDALREIHGEGLYQEIESLRLTMKSVRGKEARVVQDTLEKVYSELILNSSDELHHKAKAFSLMLESINACEAAYRAHRLAKYHISFKSRPEAIIYVFTSHPTESRSQKFLKLMRKIEDLLLEALDENFESIRERLGYLFKLSIRINLANTRRPRVKDEMEEIFHVVLRPEILREQTSLNEKNLNISFRTWVGGDKDGHPGVGGATMLESFSLSRKKILEFVFLEMKKFEDDLKLIQDGAKVRHELSRLKVSLKNLLPLKARDGRKIMEVKKVFSKLSAVSNAHAFSSPFMSQFESLLTFYPALVLPLELREDSELIRASINDRKLPIINMLKTLKSISTGSDALFYVRGLVVSMCQSSHDLLAGVAIVERELGELAIPIVPLFENEKGLLNATKILEGAFRKHPLLSRHKNKWGNRFEVMVGYSDSSKENGVFPARLLIQEGLFKLEEFLQKKNLKPVFFHGSGGSTSRGGGTVQEQISWWPQTALDIFKVTIQGEMVHRNFSHPRIMRSQVGKVLEGYSQCHPRYMKENKNVKKFSHFIQDAYRSLINDPTFQALTLYATPYNYLNLLKIGSRPTKRTTKGHFGLRAIPWILCWTQTRLLLPVWWGTGVAWQKLSLREKESLKKFYKNSHLMQSYMKNLGFTLAKVEMGVWNFNLDHAKLSEKEKEYWKNTISEELKLSIIFFHDLTGAKAFTWFRPWLGESIYFRSSMIHPLNVIQKIALERKDHVLLRETVTGIACGMLTTG